MFKTKISSKTCTLSKQKVRIVTPVGIELSISHLIISLKVPINSKESLVEASTAKSFNHSLPTRGGFDLEP